VLDGIQARLSNSSAADFTIDPSNGDVHSVTLSLARVSRGTSKDVKHVRLRLGALPAPESNLKPGNGGTQFCRSELDMLAFVGADPSAVYSSLDQTARFVPLRTCTAPIELAAKTASTKGNNN
jgi:hypothetical protein